MAEGEASYMADVKEFTAGASRTGLKKLNGLVKAAKSHEEEIKLLKKKRKNMVGVVILLCMNGAPVYYEFEGRPYVEAPAE